MPNFVIPSIFTAVDKVTSVVSKMTGAVNRYIGVSETGIARQEKWFKRLTPTLSEASKQFLSFASSAAIAGGIIATIHFSADQVMAYEKALASFRTIVSDLNNKEFAEFKKQSISVAKATGESSVKVVEAFQNIAGLNAKFAETADGLGQVTKATITLSRASGDELAPTAESLVGIMNQFGFAADQANRTINVLAAGQAVGAASIGETAEALKVFGAVAASSNTSIEQSVGLIETLAQKSIKGSEAGTALRGAFVKLQKAGLGYKSGQFQINDALEDAHRKVEKLKTAKAKDAYITKLFGLENLTAGKVLLDNIATYKEFTQSVTGTSEAQKAAGINSDTLAFKLEELKNKWTNIVTSSDSANDSLGKVKSVIGFVTEHMETLIKAVIGAVIFFGLWKAAIITMRGLLIGYNIWLGVSAALNGTLAEAVAGNTIAMTAYNAVTRLVTAAQWLWNAAMAANPIGLIIIAIAALIGLVVLIIKHWETWGETVSLFLGPLGMVINLIQAFRRNWGMITKAFKEGGILEGLKAIGKTILDAVLAPLQKVLEIASHIPGIGDWAKAGADKIADFRAGFGTTPVANIPSRPVINPFGFNPTLVGKPVTQADISRKEQEEETAFQQKRQEEDQLAATKRQEILHNQKVQIEIKDGTGRAKVTDNPSGIPIKTSSTLGYRKDNG